MHRAREERREWDDQWSSGVSSLLHSFCTTIFSSYLIDWPSSISFFFVLSSIISLATGGKVISLLFSLYLWKSLCPSACRGARDVCECNWYPSRLSRAIVLWVIGCHTFNPLLFSLTHRHTVLSCLHSWSVRQILRQWPSVLNSLSLSLCSVRCVLLSSLSSLTHCICVLTISYSCPCLLLFIVDRRWI